MSTAKVAEKENDISVNGMNVELTAKQYPNMIYFYFYRSTFLLLNRNCCTLIQENRIVKLMR